MHATDRALALTLRLIVVVLLVFAGVADWHSSRTVPWSLLLFGGFVLSLLYLEARNGAPAPPPTSQGG
jgi:di/tricarboxylate transporter